MSEHMKKVNPDARQPRRGGKRLAGKEPHHAPDTARAETTGSAPTAVKPLIPEWEETPAPQAGHGEKRRRRNMREAVRSWQESEGEISPVVTGCQALAEKAKETRRHWRRLVRERRAKRFPESERLPVQLLLLAWGMLPTLGSLLGERVIKAFAAVGCKVMVTEWDMSALPSAYTGADISARAGYDPKLDPYPGGLPDSVSRAWNRRMGDFLRLFVRYSGVISRVTAWGLTDADSWKNNFPVPGRTDYPLWFDRDYRMKPFLREAVSPE